MALHAQLKVETESLLKLIVQHPQYECGPGKRKKLFQFWKGLKLPIADTAYKWLAVITAEKVMPFYTMELQPQAQALFDAQRPTWDQEEQHKQQEIEQEVALMPRTAVEMAKQVIRGEVDAGEALAYVNNQHGVIGNLGDFFLLPRADFVNQAANKALADAAQRKWYDGGTWDPFRHIREDSTKTDLEWAKYGFGDTAAYAAAAWAYDAEKQRLQSEHLLEFWRWWLLEAIPQAWNIAAQPEDKP